MAKANLLYLGLTAVIVVRSWAQLTDLARGYFVAEAFIVLMLVRYEFSVFRSSGEA